MFEKIKDIASKNLNNLGTSSESDELNVAEENDVISATLMNKALGAVKSVKEFSIMDKVKEFTVASATTVESIDQHLLSSQSQYEINTYNVSSTAGVTAGMTLNIHFTKNSGAKDLANERSKYLILKNPVTGSEIKVARVSVADKSTAKVKDPKDGSIVTFDTKTGAIIDTI